MFNFFGFGKKTPSPSEAPQPAPQRAASDDRAAPPPQSPLKTFRQQWTRPTGGQPVDALNAQIVQAARLCNAETTAYAASQIAVPPDMMITQASGLLAQSAAAYFDSVSKLALASKAVLLKNMTENIVAQKIVQAGEDALGALVTDLLVGSAAAVAAAAGAMEAESASFAIDKINHGIESYNDLLNGKNKTAA
jgi:hypothetical protein